MRKNQIAANKNQKGTNEPRLKTFFYNLKKGCYLKSIPNRRKLFIYIVKQYSSIPLVEEKYFWILRDLKFSDGDGPNLCRVKK